MSKKRYTLYLSRPLARKFDLVAQQRQGAKSALVEEALRLTLEPQPQPGLEDGLARRLDELNRNVARIGRDTAIATETLALFVRYFLTITPPLPQSEQEPARLLGRERFDVFVAQVGRRLAGDQRLVSEVLESIANNEPDLFATASDDAPLKRRPLASGAAMNNGTGTGTGDGHE
jgi:predicted transcriptional regulator